MKVETKSYLTLLGLALLWDLLFTFPPILIHFGINADIIYRFFSPVCDQLDARSFHIFGYKLAVCSRCASIYYGFTLALAVYPLIRSLKEARLPRLFYLAVPLAAMCVDWGLDYTDLGRNTFVSRSITGGVFGISSAFFVLPAFIGLIREFSRRNDTIDEGMLVKLQEVGQSSQPSAKSERSIKNER